ncbi:LOW QUALITY PROTEIN: choline O-acetyltransferase-like [Eurytemora carolleeae]|uniref:LOW QUALITY PROTEIN: choline O-acetyltransferase-like n=1 Tax=Eurytemora carolleeae TaxID=1294199 RepID=UPI000C7853F9|nr:LOW QUALITY PROTEIN: choline O-acetyltransferase-like [Eurytemora carolleeae]|eukprot:XP_023326826.1 LOW QUALITY PROTEIN: choline O-acetyltransferase-like [Eurytemora affinis]
MSGTGYPNPPPLPPTPLPPYMASSPLRSPRDSPRSSPRTPRTNRAAEVRIQSKQRSLSMTEVTKSPSRSKVDLTRSPSRSKQDLQRSSPKRSLKSQPKKDEDIGPQVYVDLPKLPLPPLKQTMDQYLDNLKPILNEADLEKVKAEVEEWMKEGGVGEKVHAHLHQKREELDNWAYQYWLRDMYMDIRIPIPVNVNPGMVFPRLDFRSTDETLSWTSRMVRNLIPQDKAATREKGQPLCMAQYFRLMTTYRRPGLSQDSQISSGVEEKEEEHILVGRRGTWYHIPVKHNGKWKSLEDIYSSLMDVWENSENSAVLALEDRVGVMSAGDRDSWGASYAVLEEDPENKKNLELVANSLFLVCLDEETQNKSDAHRSMKDMFRQMLTGAGSRYNATNRWFDKTLQLVVTGDGVCGVCYEHSASEGIVPVVILEDIIKRVGTSWKSSIAYHPSSSNFTKLSWNLTPQLKLDINKAIQVIDSLNDENDLEVFRFQEYGKDFIKSSRCSPDAWLQLSLQLTIYRLYGYIVPTYESASTRRFQLGRVDCIRASHPEGLSWCQDMMMETKTKEEKRKSFETAIKKQTKVMIENILGYGMDIPLLGLREGTKELGLWDKQGLFKDPAFDKLNQFLLSTSQVPISLDPAFMGYGAVVPDGYGVSYNPYSSSIIFCICSFYSSPLTNSRNFATQLQRSLLDMKQLFVKGDGRK